MGKPPAAERGALGGHRFHTRGMSPYELLARWEAWYPDSLPLGHHLRERYPNRWLRIWSLPGGQRWPESERDWTELLRRHRAAGDRVLSPAGDCALIAAFVDESARLGDRWLAETFRLEPLLRLEAQKLDEAAASDDAEIDLWFAPTRWGGRLVEEAIRRRAQDQGPLFLLVALESGQVYAPYDGGADLFAPEPEAVPQLRAILREWTSPRRDGL